MQSNLLVEPVTIIDDQFVFSENVNNYPVLYIGINTVKGKIKNLYVGESNNVYNRYSYKNYEEGKNNQLLDLYHQSKVESNVEFSAYSILQKDIFNASATLQLETLFIKLLISKFSEDVVKNVKIKQNIHFYSNKDEVDANQKQIFNMAVKEIFQDIKNVKLESDEYKLLIDSERNKLNPIISDDTQSKIVEDITHGVFTSNDNYLIEGNAGTGKTLVIVKLWEKIVRQNIKQYFENKKQGKLLEFKPTFITSAKKNQIKLLKKYVDETIKTFEYTYSSSEYKEIKRLISRNDVVSIYTVGDLNKIKDNEGSVVIVDEAHGIIHSLHKQNSNVYFLRKPQSESPYPDGKYFDDKNIYYSLEKSKCIFVFDENQITKIDNIKKSNLVELFNIPDQNIMKLEINYRNKVGVYLKDLFQTGVLNPRTEIAKIKLVNSLEELIKLQKEHSIQLPKYNRLLTNVSYEWKSVYWDNNENKEYDYSELIKFNINNEKDWFENDWFLLDWLDEDWVKKGDLKKYKEWQKRASKESSKVIYPTFSYANSVIGRDLENSFIYVNKDVTVFEDRLVPNLEGCIIKYKDGTVENFNKKNWNDYINDDYYDRIYSIEKSSHQSLKYFKDPAIPTYGSCKKENLNYFIEMENYVLKNYFILFSRATSHNYIYFEDSTVRNWVQDKLTNIA